MKKAFITGITGQDGSYLSELLLDKGYEVHGLVRRVALEDPVHRMSRIDSIKDNLILYPGDVSSYSRLLEVFDKVKPDECYHLAAQSFVHESFEDPFTTFSTNIWGTQHVLSALKQKSPDTKFYFAGSSEMFGKVEETPQKETTKFHPRSPYGVTKVTGFEITRNFREAYNIFALTGILFNHESPRRGFEFVTRKITSSLARMRAGLDNTCVLGNLDAKRDWGFAGDYVESMWLMLQADKPDDYVIATGTTHSISEFIQLAGDYAGLEIKNVDLHDLSREEADKEVKKLQANGSDNFIVQHPMFYRPAEVEILRGDASKAKRELGWESKVSFEELIKMMVKSDLENLSVKAGI